jgi:hypothetical protein
LPVTAFGFRGSRVGDHLARGLWAASALACFVGCGSAESSVQGDAGSRESGADAALDTGSKESSGDAGAKFPAFAVDYPHVVKNQAAVLHSPVLVTISWPGDTSASTWEGFDDGIGASGFWSATTSEYGVAAATSGEVNHVRMTEPLPPSISYTQLQEFVIAAITAAESDAGVGDGGGGSPDASPPNPKWPAPTFDSHGNDQTLYSLFIPANVAVTDPGSGMPFCQEGGLGYHDSVQTETNGPWFPYAVNLNCAPLGVPGVEETAAHETIEGATDPYVESANLGYVGFDSDHLAWDLYTGYNDELSDACQNWQDSYFQDTGSFPFWVQRSWSNEAATLGHDPCVPAPTGPYHGVTLFPSEESAVSVDLAAIGGSNESSRGFRATVGKTLEFHVGFFSDGPTASWTISYDFPSSLMLFDSGGNPLGNGQAKVSIDKPTGNNGDVATVTVVPTVKGPAGFQVMAITWDAPAPSSGYLPHYLPVLLVDE